MRKHLKLQELTEYNQLTLCTVTLNQLHQLLLMLRSDFTSVDT